MVGSGRSIDSIVMVRSTAAGSHGHRCQGAGLSLPGDVAQRGKAEILSR
jgi:hypothetical protein